MGIRPDHAIEIAPRLMDEHDGPVLEQALKGFHGGRIHVPRKKIMWPVKKVDRLVCFSEMEKRYLVNLGVPAGLISIIPVGILYDDIPDLSLKKGSERKGLKIGLLARFTAEKGHAKIIEPMKRILGNNPDVRFIAAGPMTDARYADKFITSMSALNNFHYGGEIEYAKIFSSFYSDVDIVLIPSIEETGSITTLEAMACGKAVIASNINPHNVYIKHGKSGFLAEYEEDYYRLLSGLIDDPDKIIDTGIEARKSVRKYDWSNIGKELEKLYTTKN